MVWEGFFRAGARVILLLLSIGTFGTTQKCDITVSGPQVGRSCRLPFEFRGQIYFECTSVTDPDNKKWCSTKTFRNGTHIGGGGNWGHCPERCELPPATRRPSETTQRTTSRPLTRQTRQPFTRPTTRRTPNTPQPASSGSGDSVSFKGAKDSDSGLWIPDQNNGECGYSLNTDYVTNGRRAKVGQFPFVVLLGYQKNGQILYLCGGSLINRRYAVTAGHCQSTAQPIREVVVGEVNTNKDRDCFDCQPVQRFRISCADVTVHELFRSNLLFSQGNDIALIRLPSLVETVYENFDLKVGPVCLPYKNEANGNLRVVGWGRFSNNKAIYEAAFRRNGVNSNDLLYVDVDEISIPTCRNTDGFTKVHRARHICAAGRNGGDSCNGDSGGPLVATDPTTDSMTLKGIVSFGSNTCGDGSPGVYLNIKEYMPWILSHLRQ